MSISNIELYVIYTNFSSRIYTETELELGVMKIVSLCQCKIQKTYEYKMGNAV
jgi:hypothetical protein